MLAHHRGKGPQTAWPTPDDVDLGTQELVSGWPRLLPKREDVEFVPPRHSLNEPQIAGDHPVGPGPVHPTGKEHGDLHMASTPDGYGREGADEEGKIDGAGTFALLGSAAIGARAPMNDAA